MDDVRERFQNLHEFLKAAKFRLNRNNWDYIVGGTETETTLARNRQSLDSIAFKPRVLRNVRHVDCTSTLFGRKTRLPVMIAPANHRAHSDGEPTDAAPDARANPRRFAGTAADSTVSVSGMTIAPPRPWIARATSSAPIEDATAAAADAAVKIAIPAASIRRRPKRSPSAAPVNSNTANVSV